MMLPRIKDQHNRFKVIEHFKHSMQSMLTRLYANIGQALMFNFWNPTGIYDLNLSVPAQREVAKMLLLINKQFAIKVKAGECKDRSQKGNASCLRNEKVSGGIVVWSPEYILPHIGNFQCSFIYVVPNRPTKAESMSTDEITTLMTWFHEKHE